MKRSNRALSFLASFFKLTGVILLLLAISTGVFFYGVEYGYRSGVNDTQSSFEELLNQNQIFLSSQSETDSESNSQIVKEVVYVTPTPRPRPNWTGPELFEAVNKRRVELGVNPLANETNLCTIASLRLNQLLELGELDAHEGFIELSKREDYAYIFEKYNIFEFLLSGANSAEEAVSLWENTQGHSKLLTGGEYVWGCTYAQNGFGVAITAF